MNRPLTEQDLRDHALRHLEKAKREKLERKPEGVE